MEMGGEPVFIAEADRGLYHAALAGAANHLVTQVVQAQDLLAKAGVGHPARMLGAAAVRGPGQCAAAGGRRAHRPGGARRCRHRGRARARAAADAPEALPAYLAMARLTAAARWRAAC